MGWCTRKRELGSYSSMHGASCRILANEIDDIDSPYVIDEKDVLTRRSRLDGTVENVTPASIRRAMLCDAHDRILVGHSGERCMSETMKRMFYWPHMSSDVYA